MGIFVAAIIRFVPKLRELLTSIQTMKIHSGSLNVVLKRFRQASEMSEIRVGERLFQQLKSGIEFKDVNFNYDSSSAPALQGINLFIPVNQVTAIVGPSGAGKSTLVDLIPRFLEPSAGKVYSMIFQLIIFNWIPQVTHSLLPPRTKNIKFTRCRFYWLRLESQVRKIRRRCRKKSWRT